jgi:hypothetical protein
MMRSKRRRQRGGTGSGDFRDDRGVAGCSLTRLKAQGAGEGGNSFGFDMAPETGQQVVEKAVKEIPTPFAIAEKRSNCRSVFSSIYNICRSRACHTSSSLRPWEQEFKILMRPDPTR